MAMRTLEESALVTGAGELWREGTTAKFLEGIGDGTLPPEAFERWLAQDYLFARGLTSFQAVMAAKAPRDAHGPLIGGLAAMHAEMSWFESHLADRGIDLQADAHPVYRRYVDFLIASAYSAPFEVLCAIVYGVEVSYLAAWSALEAAGPYAEFIERWSSEPFTEYVRSLLELCNRHPHRDQQAAFNQVLRHERDFWRMTWEG
ncbi:MAG TPA: TenA family transcriptional regulator [Phycisphaerae bacterium]|nr:TenA family transcriptional regulator [Phycisphaerae bacterium]